MITQEARDRLGKPSIFDPGRFGVAIGYDTALERLQSVLDERNAATVELTRLRTLLEEGKEAVGNLDTAINVLSGIKQHAQTVDGGTLFSHGSDMMEDLSVGLEYAGLARTFLSKMGD